ncbi:MAG: carboxypeptidase regulatory-like domain-containing protein [Ruminococcaceae bacterium]|nr:carboxypeptidase regulatory-like domain-containing protein [Oscillospiraceae bacterium]
MNGRKMGRLLINLRYANNAVPVKSARVVLYNSLGDALGEYLTDVDGKTSEINLPIGDYAVNILADGFVETEFTDIPIEEEILTLQTLQLFPLYNYSSEVV